MEREDLGEILLVEDTAPNSGGEMENRIYHKKNEEVIPSKNRHSNPSRFWLALIIFLLVSLLACQFTQKAATPVIEAPVTLAPDIQEPPTATATEENLQATQWAEQTAQAPATQTQQAREAEATQFVIKLTEDAIAEATKAFYAPVLNELPNYGVDSNSGHVAWVHNPASASADGYHASDIVNDYGDLSVKDFLLAADINWDTQYGISGCGFTFRSDGNQQVFNQYMVVFTRSTDGHIFFNTLFNGKLANFKDFYANIIDPDLDWENGASNRMAILVRGNSVKIFTNQKFIGEVNLTDPPPQNPTLPVKPVKPQPPADDLTGKELQEAKKAYQTAMEQYKQDLEAYTQQVAKLETEHSTILNAYRQMGGAVYEEGFVGLLAYAASGYSNCQFNNAWLWVFD